MNYIDNFLNSITMYRLILYFLIVLAITGLIFSFFGILPFDILDYVFSFTFLLIASYISNRVFAYVFEAPTNVESVYITALILGLIINPARNLIEVIFLGWAATLAMASKYMFAIGRKHIFNPVAISVFLTAMFINGTATWWVGTLAMLPATVIGGFLIIRKIRRWDLALSFLGVSIISIFISGILRGANPLSVVWRSIADTGLIFFVSIMLTEPLTTPPTSLLRMVYGGLVGLLFTPQIHIGSFYTTPEIALIIGNIYSYIVSPKYKLMLILKEKLQLSTDVWDFIFAPSESIRFTPGQYMEFTFQHPNSDTRGNRRYLSLASSPTESDLRIGIKFGDPPSSYKKYLLELSPGQKIMAGQLAGDFTLPKDPSKKLAFIAGGIGITPFRSMIKYLIDKNEKRDITILYTASESTDLVYKDVLDEAAIKLGIKTIYIDTKTQGHCDAARLAREVPDYSQRTFYISGSHKVVETFENIIKVLGVPQKQVVTDYFPGF